MDLLGLVEIDSAESALETVWQRIMFQSDLSFLWFNIGESWSLWLFGLGLSERCFGVQDIGDSRRCGGFRWRTSPEFSLQQRRSQRRWRKGWWTQNTCHPHAPGDCHVAVTHQPALMFMKVLYYIMFVNVLGLKPFMYSIYPTRF